ncbi:MAG: hypothetical protein R2758_00550 [Bacteroidales bacterium]
MEVNFPSAQYRGSLSHFAWRPAAQFHLRMAFRCRFCCRLAPLRGDSLAGGILQLSFAYGLYRI